MTLCDITGRREVLLKCSLEGIFYSMLEHVWEKKFFFPRRDGNITKGYRTDGWEKSWKISRFFHICEGSTEKSRVSLLEQTESLIDFWAITESFQSKTESNVQLFFFFLIRKRAEFKHIVSVFKTPHSDFLHTICHSRPMFFFFFSHFLFDEVFRKQK